MILVRFRVNAVGSKAERSCLAPQELLKKAFSKLSKDVFFEEVGSSEWSSTESNCGTCWHDTLTHGPVVGATTDRDVRIWVRTDSTRHVTIRMARKGEPLSVAGHAYPRPDSDFTHTFHIRGLRPSTSYAYEIAVDGTSKGAWSFTTAPEPNTPVRVKLAVGSCANTYKDPRQSAFGAVAELAPDLLLMTGDNVYFDPKPDHRVQKGKWRGRGEPTDLDGARAFYRDAVRVVYPWHKNACGQWNGDDHIPADCGRQERVELSAHVPVLATWDDHDFLGNDNVGVREGKPWPERSSARQAFAEYMPNPQYVEENGAVYFKHTIGEIDIFMLDGRYHRDESPFKTHLGGAQLEWLIRELESSRAKFKLIVSGSEWQMGAGGDSWADYPKERTRIFDAIAGVPGVVLVSGDPHFSEFRILPGQPAGYPIPNIVSSGIASPLKPCRPWRGEGELIACHGEDASDPQKRTFVLLEIDTVAIPMRLTASIRNQLGTVLSTWDLTLDKLQPGILAR